MIAPTFKSKNLLINSIIECILESIQSFSLTLHESWAIVVQHMKRLCHIFESIKDLQRSFSDSIATELNKLNYLLILIALERFYD